MSDHEHYYFTYSLNNKHRNYYEVGDDGKAYIMKKDDFLKKVKKDPYLSFFKYETTNDRGTHQVHYESVEDGEVQILPIGNSRIKLFGKRMQVKIINPKSPKVIQVVDSDYHIRILDEHYDELRNSLQSSMVIVNPATLMGSRTGVFPRQLVVVNGEKGATILNKYNVPSDLQKEMQTLCGNFTKNQQVDSHVFQYPNKEDGFFSVMDLQQREDYKSRPEDGKLPLVREFTANLLKNEIIPREEFTTVSYCEQNHSLLFVFTKVGKLFLGQDISSKNSMSVSKTANTSQMLEMVLDLLTRIHRAGFTFPDQQSILESFKFTFISNGKAYLLTPGLLKLGSKEERKVAEQALAISQYTLGIAEIFGEREERTNPPDYTNPGLGKNEQEGENEGGASPPPLAALPADPRSVPSEFKPSGRGFLDAARSLVSRRS